MALVTMYVCMHVCMYKSSKSWGWCRSTRSIVWLAKRTNNDVRGRKKSLEGDGSDVKRVWHVSHENSPTRARESNTPVYDNY